MRKTLGICLLVLLLTSSAGAGEMPNLSPVPPPSQPGYIPNETPASPEPTSAADETAADGWMGNEASLTQVAWEVLAVLPSLL